MRYVDFRKRNTERGWQETIDEFWLKATPLLFTWVEWTLMLGVLKYISITYSTLWYINIIYILLLISLLFYFSAYFYQFYFGFFKKKDHRIGYLISLIISAVLSGITFMAVNFTVEVIAKHSIF
jgi:hypothetical protein